MIRREFLCITYDHMHLFTQIRNVCHNTVLTILIILIEKTKTFSPFLFLKMNNFNMVVTPDLRLYNLFQLWQLLLNWDVWQPFQRTVIRYPHLALHTSRHLQNGWTLLPMRPSSCPTYQHLRTQSRHKTISTVYSLEHCAFHIRLNWIVNNNQVFLSDQFR